jgi:hypothetical protein
MTTINVPHPTDHIEVNVGGRVFETTTMTLKSSGSKFFQALLGLTGTTLAGGESNSNIDSNGTGPVFLDRDPDLFADVLYFMRSQRLPASTRKNVDRLDDLSSEADFFVYDELQQACQDSLDDYQQNLPTAQSYWIKVDETPRRVAIPQGQMIYIVSATPAWKQATSYHELLPPPDDGSIFHHNNKLALKALWLSQIYVLLEAKRECLAEHSEDSSLLPLSLSSLEECSSLELVVEGRGTIDVMYWLGHASAIPMGGNN